MRVAIHQPNYLPWIGFFDKLDQVDIFVLLDTANYSKTSFVNRNYVKTPQGKHRLTVPIKEKNRLINQLVIDNSTNWKKTHWRVIESNYKKSPYWEHYKTGLNNIYAQKWEKLVEINIALIYFLVEALGIETEIVLESDLGREFGTGNTRNVEIVTFLHGKTYVSGVGAKVYNNTSEFQKNGTTLQYQLFNHPAYIQLWGEFIPNLSIIDMLFACGPDVMNILRKQRQEQRGGVNQ